MIARRLGLWFSLLLGGALLLVLWAMLVWVASRPALKAMIDLTPQRVNSVDPATEELLRELRAQQATIEFHQFYPPYSGQAVDDVKRQEYRIREQLRQFTRLLLLRYQYIGAESVKIVAHDLYGDPQGTRAAAQAFDYRDSESDVLVVAVQMPGKERRFRKLSLPLDLGRIERPNTGTGVTGRQSLPVLKQFVGEVQISSTLKSLLVEGTPIAYVLNGFSALLSVGEAGSSYSELFAQLGRSGFELRPWDAKTQPAVPKDASVVLVLEPTRNFTDAVTDSLYAYLQRGGRVFLNYCWQAAPPDSDWNPDGGRLGELLGYQLSKDPVFHLIPDPHGRSGGRGYDNNPAVAKLQLFVNRVHPVTRRIAESGRPMEVAAARAIALRPDAPEAIKREELLATGEQAWIARPGPDGMPSTRAPQTALSQYVVGIVCEVPIPAAADAPKPAPGAPTSGQAVVVSGIFCNNTGMPYFGDLALNICNWMAERRVLLDLKTPAYEAKPLTLQPPQLERVGNLLIYGVPLTFLVLGGVVFFVRRRQ